MQCYLEVLDQGEAVGTNVVALRGVNEGLVHFEDLLDKAHTRISLAEAESMRANPRERRS